MFFDKINAALLTVGVLDFFLALIILFNSRRKKINIVYGFNIIAIIGWILAMIAFRSATGESALFWCTVLYVAPTLIASTFLYFTFIFPQKAEKGIILKTLAIIAANVIIVIMVAWPGLIIKQVIFKVGSEKQIIFTKFYFFYFVYIFGLFTYGFVRLFKKYFKTKGIEKLQVTYFLSGYVFGANLAFITNLIMPWLGFFYLNWLGQIFTVIIVVFTTYAILLYRLMDIRIVIRKIFYYSAIVGFIYGLFYFMMWLYSLFFENILELNALIFGVIIIPFAVLTVYLFNKLLVVFLNKYLFVSLYNYQETINKLTEELNYYIDLNKIVNLIVNTIKKTMRLDKAGLLLFDNKPGGSFFKAVKIVGFNYKKNIQLAENNFFVKYLLKTQNPLVKEELRVLISNLTNTKKKKNLNELYKYMVQIDASLCLPLMATKKLIGIVILGSKTSGDAYTKEDLEILNVMSKQAGTAIENARLYIEVKQLSSGLKKKVNEQTKHLKELLKMKSDFLRVVNHQLNTPLSLMKSYFSMMESKEYPSEKAILSVKKGLERISSTIEEFWDAYELEGEKIKIVPKIINIDNIISSIIRKKLSLEIVKERKLSIKKTNLDFKIPLVWCDEEKISHAVSNLIDNAVYYTPKGTITVFYEKMKDDMLKVNIKDTGIGISKKNQQKIFQKFYRGDDSTRFRADGSGLGLFIAKKIIESSGGKLTYFSAGKNKGSVFSFTLPIYKKKNLKNMLTIK